MSFTLLGQAVYSNTSKAKVIELPVNGLKNQSLSEQPKSTGDLAVVAFSSKAVNDSIANASSTELSYRYSLDNRIAFLRAEEKKAWLI